MARRLTLRSRSFRARSMPSAGMDSDSSRRVYPQPRPGWLYAASAKYGNRYSFPLAKVVEMGRVIAAAQPIKGGSIRRIEDVRIAMPHDPGGVPILATVNVDTWQIDWHSDEASQYPGASRKI